MRWLLILTLAVMMAGCKKEGSSPPATPYVTRLLEYTPAPGQFINTSVGNDTAARSVLGGKGGIVSLGAWGGYVVYGFDHTVANGDGADIIVYGNAFNQFAEPGVIWVMQDKNGNGQPDDTWYELAGSETGKQGYLTGYAVTYTRPHPANGNVPWTDNHNGSGMVLTNMYHTQDYYPDDLTSDSYTLYGTLLPSSNVDTSQPSFVISLPFAYGYADSTPGGDSVDISHAVDGSGKSISLKGIDFIKVQTGVQANMGWLGELSTEVTGIADLHLLK